jgi:hypothetical protein
MRKCVAYRLVRVHDGVDAAGVLRIAVTSNLGLRRFRELNENINAEANRVNRNKREIEANHAGQNRIPPFALDVESQTMLQNLPTDNRPHYVVNNKTTLNAQ